MSRSSLARDIRDAFLNARDEADQELARLYLREAALAGLTAEDLVMTAREQIDAGRVWLALLRAYRGGSSNVLGPVLLEMLAPSLAAASIRLRPVPPVVTEEDIRQELVLEALRAFATGALPRDPRWIPRHVTLRATQAVVRHLVLEKRRQDVQLSLDEDAADHVDPADQGLRRIPRLQNVRPRAHNVRLKGPRHGIAHVHMRSRSVIRSSAGTAVPENKS